MTGVSRARLNVLRATYLFILGGLALTIWPAFLQSPHLVGHMTGVVRCVLAAVSLLAIVGLRYPLRMLPLLAFEFLWKAVWIVAIGLPRWMAGGLDAAHTATMFENLLGVVLVPLVLPWKHVLESYLRAPSESAAGETAAPPAAGALPRRSTAPAAGVHRPAPV
jgi:hypothetical protein